MVKITISHRKQDNIRIAKHIILSIRWQWWAKGLLPSGSRCSAGPGDQDIGPQDRTGFPALGSVFMLRCHHLKNGADDLWDSLEHYKMKNIFSGTERGGLSPCLIDFRESRLRIIKLGLSFIPTKCNCQVISVHRQMALGTVPFFTEQMRLYSCWRL